MPLIGGAAVTFAAPALTLRRRRPIRCAVTDAATAEEAALLRRAAEVADLSAGHTSPHPNFGCVIARCGDVVGEGFLYAQGTKCAELQAVEKAGGLARGATAYLNMEPGDCYSDHTAVSSLVQAGISRVVIGLRHPLQHLRGKAIQSLRSESVQVDVLGEDLQSKTFEDALKSCLMVNAPLLYRAAFRVPFSVLKYAMTLDGKIATMSGHASWISSKVSRGRVFELRGRSDAIVVGGNTVRRDDPQLTARHGGGHVPVRIVMSRTLNLPDEAKLWNVTEAYTIVTTQRGARRDLQKKLAKKGVEVVEFDILNSRDVMEYCYDRGYLSVLWECGGALSAPAISSGVIHKVGPDMLISGFLQPIPDLSPVIPSSDEISILDPTVSPFDTKIISFYKTWDPYGAFSNYSPHPIQMPDENGNNLTWSTMEHYYQAHKFVGVDNPLAKDAFEQIKMAKSPEEASRLGRKLQRQHPEVVRADWDSAKIDIMYGALKCKFSTYPHLEAMLCSTAGSVLVEASPHDLFWGGGREGEGLNYLGRLLMQLRTEILEESSKTSVVS
nr:PREDICTED: riboflavin biosynthesis protein PYRR, chloroplastic isoform X2 [Musa acuminata subsp. malaccensis]